MCIPEEHSFCSTINSQSDTESDLDSDLNSPAGERFDGGDDGFGGGKGRRGGGGEGGGGGDMSVVSDMDYRDYDNGSNEELKREIRWKGRGKKRSDDKTEGKGALHHKKGRNKKKSGELWMKNQKNCVLQE